MKRFALLLATVALTAVFAHAQTDVEKLYTAKCLGCHGADGSKVPPGADKATKGMSRADLEKALLGYKDGSYGGAKKASMVVIMRNIADEDVKALAAFMADMK